MAKIEAFCTHCPLSLSLSPTAHAPTRVGVRKKAVLPEGKGEAKRGGATGVLIYLIPCLGRGVVADHRAGRGREGCSREGWRARRARERERDGERGSDSERETEETMDSSNKQCQRGDGGRRKKERVERRRKEWE